MIESCVVCLLVVLWDFLMGFIFIGMYVDYVIKKILKSYLYCVNLKLKVMFFGGKINYIDWVFVLVLFLFNLLSNFLVVI